jgi:hypothetical protein
MNHERYKIMLLDTDVDGKRIELPSSDDPGDYSALHERIRQYMAVELPKANVPGHKKPAGAIEPKPNKWGLP